jgi:RNase P subunit RPR2
VSGPGRHWLPRLRRRHQRLFCKNCHFFLDKRPAAGVSYLRQGRFFDFGTGFGR